MSSLSGQPDVASLEAIRDVDGLIKLLNYKSQGGISTILGDDYKVCSAAAEALGRIGDARAVEPLIAALKNSESVIRSRAVTALGRIGDARAVEPLIAATHDSDAFVSIFATQALEAMGLDSDGSKKASGKSEKKKGSKLFSWFRR